MRAPRARWQEAMGLSAMEGIKIKSKGRIFLVNDLAIFDANSYKL
jgi:hypothetical protein